MSRFVHNRFEVLLLIILAVILLPGVFCGFELCDSGFYLTAYQNIFTDPECVGYNFMYYLSLIVGGAFENGSIIGMRLLGVGVILLSCWMVVRMTAHYVPSFVAAVSIIAVISAYLTSPLTFYYDHLTLILLLSSISLLVSGIKPNKPYHIALSGVLLGMAIFARIPNVLLFCLCILIPIFSSKPKQQICIFIGGYLLGIASVIILMQCLGHWEIFLKNISLLLKISEDNDASHGIRNLITSQIAYYKLMAVATLKLTAMGFIAWSINKYIKNGYIKAILSLPVVVYLCFFIRYSPPTLLLGAATIPLLCCQIFTKSDKSLLAAAALLSAIIIPLGSDYATNFGSIIYLLGAPLALEQLLKSQLPRFAAWLAIGIFTLMCLIRICIGGVYFDDTPLWQSSSQINSSKAVGIYTSCERTTIVDNALQMLSDHVQPDDTLMAFGSSPMLNYLTDTKPYISNSWPEQLSAQQLKAELCEAKGSLPWLCVQRFQTISSSWPAPSLGYLRATEHSNCYHTPEKQEVIYNFLRVNNYLAVDSTLHFTLYMPPREVERRDLRQ